jgi:hypothetical protein
MSDTEKAKSEPHPLRIPGFLNEKDIGMGDVIKRAAAYFGIPPCGSCQSRAAALNSRFVFSARPKNQKLVV